MILHDVICCASPSDVVCKQSTKDKHSFRECALKTALISTIFSPKCTEYRLAAAGGAYSAPQAPSWGLFPVVKVDRRFRWHYTKTLRLRIGARLTRYRNCKFHNFACTISRHADGISRYSVPPSAGGPLLPLPIS